jgi:hypothetical protein
MGVKVVSVEKRDTPTRYDLFYVRVVYGQDESDVPLDRMVFRSLFPAEGAKTQAVAVPPPPPPSILLLGELLRVFREGTDIGWIITYFRKSNPYGSEIKLCHRGADIFSRSELFWVSRPT